jgi:outer membrane lipoprotein-sorting protein
LLAAFGKKSPKKNIPYNDETYDTYVKIYDTYSQIKSYVSEIDVKVISNLGERKYSLKEFYKSPNRYRIDSVSQPQTEGFYYVFDENSVTLHSPFGKEGVTLQNFIPKEKNYISLADFFKHYYESEDSESSQKLNMSGKFLELSTKLEPNQYHFEQNLEINPSTFLPLKLTTFDINKKPVIVVDYNDFKLDEEIDDNLFQK